MAACLILSTLLGSAFFAGLSGVAVGRLLVEEGHRALVVSSSGVHVLAEGENSALYGLAPIPEGYLAVGHVGEVLLRVRLSPQGTPLWAEAGDRGSSGARMAASPGEGIGALRGGKPWP